MANSRCREVDPAHAGGVHSEGSGIQEGHGDPERAMEADMMASHTNGIHRTRSPRLRVLHSGCRYASWAMMTRQARRSSAIQHDTVRCGFLPRRSYVAPSRRSRGSAKRPRIELTYCPIYGFKPYVLCTQDLTPALFCCWCMAGALGSIPEIVLHPPLHRAGKKKPHYQIDSGVSFIYLVGREGLEPATKGL